MKFNIYGRFHISVLREKGAWAAYRSEMGKRTLLPDVVVPPDLAADELAVYLDDIFHEFAGIGQRVEPISD